MGTLFSTKGVVSLPPVYRRLLLIGIDALLLPLAVWLSFWLRLAHPFHTSFMAAGIWLLLAVLLVGLPLYAFTGQYKGLTRYVGSAALSIGWSQRTPGAVACCYRCDAEASYASPQ